MSVKKIFTIESDISSYVEREGVSISFEHVVPRQEFISEFDIGDVSNVMQLSYEPFRNLYHIVDSDYNLTVIDSVSESDVMKAIHDNIDNISNWFKTDYKSKNPDPKNEDLIPILG